MAKKPKKRGKSEAELKSESCRKIAEQIRKTENKLLKSKNDVKELNMRLASLQSEYNSRNYCPRNNENSNESDEEESLTEMPQRPSSSE